MTFHMFVKKAKTLVLIVVILWPFVLVEMTYLYWRISDYPIGRDTISAWNNGQVQLLRNPDDSSYSLYWKGDIVCSDIQSYDQYIDRVVFIFSTDQYEVYIESGTMSVHKLRESVETFPNDSFQAGAWSK